MVKNKTAPQDQTTENDRHSSTKDASKSQFGMILSLASGAIGKWQKNLTEDRRQKIRSQFTIPRNDILDPFKPNSETATTIICQQPFGKPLPPDEEDMLQNIAVNYDYCLPLDIVEWRHQVKDISVEIREQLDKLPTWLKALVMLRFDLIQNHFGPRTHYFLRLLANRVDYQRSIPMKIFEMEDDEDEEDFYIINKNFIVTDDDFAAPVLEPVRRHKSVHKADLFRVAHAIALWRLPKSARAEWAPQVVHRSACTLRRGLLTQATPAEIAMVREDEKANVLSDESDDENVYKAQTWQEIISERIEFKHDIRKEVDAEFSQVPREFKNLNEDVAPRIKRRRERARRRLEQEKQQKHAEKSQQTCWKRNKLYTIRKAKQDKRDELINRGLYRRYSRIWYKNCPKEEIAPSRRRTHHYRCDEGFHAYCVDLVGSQFFKSVILGIIVANAIVLAIETGDIDEDAQYVDVFEVLDNFFLSVYLTEFLLKVYAHPQRFWRSGFNIFDFFILIISFVKASFDWLSLSDLGILRVLIIVRALRILRGVSLNIQIQVLVTALVETLKTHVLSVLILLVLLMYIAAIIAFYMFGQLIPAWGNIGTGMMNLFAFVTSDGWTDITKEFEKYDVIHAGRLFCLVGIVLGNFVFSNIFIAIIIMQISEATDAFRNKQLEEREAVVIRKKETVFRRQKLDMRQLLARQKLSISADFYYLAGQFQRLLRHDDLVDMREIPFSPMWLDCVHKCSQRCLHTANMLMNLHRQVADTLLKMYLMNNNVKGEIKPIRRARYNRVLRLKAKLVLLKQELYRSSREKLGIHEPRGDVPSKKRMTSF